MTELISSENRTVSAGQWRLIWRKFIKHRLALIGGILTILIYLIAIFAEFIAPFTPDRYGADYTHAPPQPLHFFSETAAGRQFAPYVYGYTIELNYEQGRRLFVPDPAVQIPVSFFVKGEPYQLLGFIDMEIHFLGPENPDDPMFLIGADRLGRDILSRTIYGTRISKKDLQDEFNLTYLFISHDLSVVAHISDRVAVMYVGKIVELAPTAALFQQPQHPYTEALLSAVLHPDPTQRNSTRIHLEGSVADPSNPPRGCAFHPRCRYAQERCHQELPALRASQTGHLVACHFAETLDLVGVG